MTRPTTDTLRERGLICTAIKLDGQPCCYKKRPGYNVCSRHGAPTTPVVTAPPITCECPVCYEVKPAKLLPCKHSVCDDCSESWFINNTTCPMCRAVVKEPVKPSGVERRINQTYGTIAWFLNSVDEIYNTTNRVRDNDPAAAMELLQIIDLVRPIISHNRRLLVNAAARSESAV